MIKYARVSKSELEGDLWGSPELATMVGKRAIGISRTLYALLLRHKLEVDAKPALMVQISTFSAGEASFKHARRFRLYILRVRHGKAPLGNPLREPLKMVFRTAYKTAH